MRIPTHAALNLVIRGAPASTKDLPGRGIQRSAGFGIRRHRLWLRCHRARLALCGNSVKSLALRACRGQRIARVTDVQEPSNKRAADDNPVRSRGATVIVEGDKDGNASGAEKINSTEVKDQAG